MTATVPVHTRPAAGVKDTEPPPAAATPATSAVDCVPSPNSGAAAVRRTVTAVAAAYAGPFVTPDSVSAGGLAAATGFVVKVPAAMDGREYVSVPPTAYEHGPARSTISRLVATEAVSHSVAVGGVTLIVVPPPLTTPATVACAWVPPAKGVPAAAVKRTVTGDPSAGRFVPATARTAGGAPADAVTAPIEVNVGAW